MIGLMIVLLSMGIVSGQQAVFNIYALPVGQGEALVLECPNRDIAIVDLGSSDSAANGFWNTAEINQVFTDYDIFSRTKNIVITHNHADHYNLLPTVFTSANMLPALENIYISRTESELPADLKPWITMMKANANVQLINAGREFCSLPTDPNIFLELCPGDTRITSKVLFANLGNSGTPNTNSIVLLIKFNQFSVLLNGDFDDIPSTACGLTFTPADKIAQYEKMKSTVYKLAHHGSTTNNANNDAMLNAIKPKAIFVSANLWYNSQQYGHPRCHIMDYLTTTINALCLPFFNCGLLFQPQAPISCCWAQYDCWTYPNDHAIYTTAPIEFDISSIALSTDGISWVFSYKNYPRTSLSQAIGQFPASLFRKGTQFIEPHSLNTSSV